MCAVPLWPSLRKNGGEIVASERFSSDITDFRSQLTKLLTSKPDALHIAPQSEFAAGTIIKQLRELGYAGPIYGETIAVGTTSLDIAGDAATGMKAITAAPDPNNEKAQEVLANFRERYDYITLPLAPRFRLRRRLHHRRMSQEDRNDDQDADAFRDCLYGITWTGAIGYGYSFDENGEVVGLSRTVVEILPVSERTQENYGYRVLIAGGSN